VASPTWAEHLAQTNQLPAGLKPAPLAIPEYLVPTAVYNPGVTWDIPTLKQPEHGAWLLSSVAEWFGHYSRYQSVSDIWKITLWAFMTHVRDPKTKRPLIPMIPKLLFLGESGSGKSTDLQLLNLVCACTDDLEVEPTEPAVRQMLGPEQLTFMLDEADILFGSGNRKSAIRSILNACSYPNGHTSRIQGGKRVKDYVYGPAAIAALPAMEVSTGSVLESLINRSHKVYKETTTEDIPQILFDEEGMALGSQARKMIAAWAQDNLAEIVAAITTVKVPDAINREAQKWRGMMAVAQVAGGMWPQYAANAALGTKDTGSLSDFRSKLGRLGK
jgi:hypothetical protein